MLQAGLGLTGVEGAFRNGCEAAAVVLCDSSDTLTALMRAIVHDPLVVWGSDREGAAAKKARPHCRTDYAGSRLPCVCHASQHRHCQGVCQGTLSTVRQAECFPQTYRCIIASMLSTLQELEVAVSLALFSSRMAEMGPAISTALDSLPDALASSAVAITAFSAAFEAAAAASVEAGAAHRVAQEANVRLQNNATMLLAKH